MNQRLRNFGPWTTSLSAGSHLELSAFWRRRMAALAKLPLASPRRRRLGAAAIAIAAVIMAMPLAVRQSASAADESSAAIASKEPAAGASNAKFVARFSNGVEVELIGLSMNPSKDKAWWWPDGSPLAERPYAKVMAIMGSGLTREICWRWKNLPKDSDYTLDWNTVPAYGCAGGCPVDANGKSMQDLSAVAVGLSAAPDACTVTFSTSVSATPWKTVFDDDGRHYSSSGSAVDGKPRGVAWSPAREEGEALMITVSYRVGAESVRLVAVRKSGDRQPQSEVFGGGAWEFSQKTFKFDKLRVDDVDHFELQTQTREMETVEFVNVSLHPEKQTKVETRVVQATAKSPKN